MSRENLLKEMKDSVGTKDPIEFFSKMTDMFSLIFDRLDRLEVELHKVKMHSSLAINWDSKIAANLLSNQVTVLRGDKDTFSNEIFLLKKAFAEDKVTQSYKEFCQFWSDTLGYHPFLE